MPPRSYYNSPRKTDYLAYLKAFGADSETLKKSDKFLDINGVPPISGLNEIAQYLSVETSTLFNILRKKEKNYRLFPIQQLNKADRNIEAPRTYIKVVHWWILDNILSTFNHDDCIHGFVKNRSYFTNAQAHFGAKHLLTLDIEKFFPNVRDDQVSIAFQKFGYPKPAADVLTEFCTLYRRLPQGAPTSPNLSNIVFSDIDEKLKLAAVEENLVYTRYADDLTFSGQNFINQSFYKNVKAIIGEGGFKLNHKKTRFLGKGDRMEVTGLVINEKIQLPRRWRMRARAMFHRATLNPVDFVDRINEIYGIHNTLKHFESHHMATQIASGKSIEEQKLKLIQLGEMAIFAVTSASKF